MTKSYFNLPDSEAVLVQSAVNLYAAYIVAGRVLEGEEKDWMRRSLKEVMSFAKTIDELDDLSNKESPRRKMPGAKVPDAGDLEPLSQKAPSAETSEPQLPPLEDLERPTASGADDIPNEPPKPLEIGPVEGEKASPEEDAAFRAMMEEVNDQVKKGIAKGSKPA